MPTSGTAGEPKLVELHRVAVVVAVSRSAKRLGATPGAPWLCPLTPAHIGGLLVLLRGAILGAPVTMHERFDPERLVHDGEGAAFASVVPAMVRRLVASDLGLHGLTLLVGGDGIDDETADGARARGARIVTTYGLTETCGGFTYDGVPLDGMQVRLDADGAIEVSGIDGDGGLPARPGRDRRRVHDRRMAAHRRPGRDRRRRRALGPRSGRPRDPDRRREGLARGGRASAVLHPKVAGRGGRRATATPSGERT